MHLDGWEYNGGWRSEQHDLECAFDGDLLFHYGPGWHARRHGRTPLPVCIPMCNKFVGGPRTYERRLRRHGGWNMHGLMRNIKTGQPPIAGRFHIGEVVRHGSWTFIHNMEGRRTNA